MTKIFTLKTPMLEETILSTTGIVIIFKSSKAIKSSVCKELTQCLVDSVSNKS